MKRAPRLLLSGPCGVGKSTVAALVESSVPGVRHLEVDKLRLPSTGMTVAPGCSLAGFDLEVCLSPHLEQSPSGFVIDIGGDTLFRRAVDNDQRVEQLLTFKRRHGVRVVLLAAREPVLRSRFLACKSRHAHEFDETFQEWQDIAYPHWLTCADRVIDVAGFGLGDAAQADDLVELLLAE